MAEEDTSVRIKKDTWQRLNARKEPGKSFDDIISELLDQVEEAEEAEEGNPNSVPGTAV